MKTSKNRPEILPKYVKYICWAVYFILSFPVLLLILFDLYNFVGKQGEWLRWGPPVKAFIKYFPDYFLYGFLPEILTPFIFGIMVLTIFFFLPAYLYRRF